MDGERSSEWGHFLKPAAGSHGEVIVVQTAWNYFELVQLQNGNRYRNHHPGVIEVTCDLSLKTTSEIVCEVELV